MVIYLDRTGPVRHVTNTRDSDRGTAVLWGGWMDKCMDAASSHSIGDSDSDRGHGGGARRAGAWSNGAWVWASRRQGLEHV